MKDLLKKIKGVMSNYPRIVVLLLVLILIIVIFVLFRIADEYLNYSKVDTENFYMYTGEVKHEFEADVTINRKGVISQIKPYKKINFTSNPIINEDKMIFPSDMILLLPTENYKEYRLLPYSYINKDAEIVTKDFEEKLSNYVLYDGQDTYYFSEKGTLKYDDSTINLESGSYVISEGNKVFYYDLKNDKNGVVELSNRAIFQTKNYEVDVLNDTIGHEGNVLPTSFEYIDFISKYTDLQK